MVKTSASLDPPLLHPRSPEFPLGVVTFTLAVPEAEINAVVIVTCNSPAFGTCVASVVPLMTTTEDETKWLPFTVRRNPCWTWANVMVVGERLEMLGAGRALEQRGFSELQPCKTSIINKSVPLSRKKALVRFMDHRTPGRGTAQIALRKFAFVEILKSTLDKSSLAV
jgi:hypothetical protein